MKKNKDIPMKINQESNPLKELFGSGKFSKPTKQLLKEARKNTSKFW